MKKLLVLVGMAGLLTLNAPAFSLTLQEVSEAHVEMMDLHADLKAEWEGFLESLEPGEEPDPALVANINTHLDFAAGYIAAAVVFLTAPVDLQTAMDRVNSADTTLQHTMELMSEAGWN